MSARHDVDADAAWLGAGITGLVVALVFASYEIVERLWLSRLDPTWLSGLHIVRGLLSTLLAAAAILWFLRRPGGLALPDRGDGIRRPERVGRKNSWLISLRWLAGAGVVVALSLARVLGALSPGVDGALWGAAIALLAFNAALAALKREGRLGEGALTLQLALDSAILTFLLHFSGGLENPFFLLYLFHGQVGAILLPRRESARLVAWSASLLLLLGFGEYSGALAHHPLLLFPHAPGLRCHAREFATLGPLLFAFLLVYAGTCFFTSAVMALLRSDNERVLAAERLAALGRIVGFVAHEVNNPIGVISTKAHLALARPQLLGNAERMRSSMEMIARQADRVATIVRGLLSAVYPLSTPRDELPLAHVLDEVSARLEPRFRAAGVRLERVGRAGGLLRDARFSEVAQVFSSLLLNALEASSRGGAVRLRCCDGPGWAEVAVEDEGVGIAAEQLPRLFEPFFTTKAGRGAGLGLALCRALVTSHGGEISAAGNPGRGAVFTVRLPTANPKEAAS